MEVKIILKTEHWLVVDKPCEWLTVPSRQGAEDARACLGRHLEKQLAARIWPVHRLDFEVSGLVLFALSSEAHRLANGWFENHQVTKTYEAISLGRVAPEFLQTQEWRSRLVRGKRRSFVANHGQEAITIAKCEGDLPLRPQDFTDSSGYSIWNLQPMTGRAHQLRVEMFRHGHAILGDELYSGPKWKRGGIALRACHLDFSKIPLTQRFELPERIETTGLAAFLNDYIPST